MTALPQPPFDEDDGVIPMCDKCQVVHARDGIPTCKAHRTDKSACTAWPMKGGVVCRKHGGKVPNTLAKAMERTATQKLFTSGRVGHMMETIRKDVGNMHPLDGLLYAVTESAVMARLYSGMVAELGTEVDAPPMLWGVDDTGSPVFKMPKNLYGKDHTGDGAPHTLVNEYFRWMNFHVRSCKTALDANIDERMVRNATMVSDHMFAAFQDAVKAADLTPAQSQKFGAALAASLRKLGQGTVPGKVVRETPAMT